MNQDLVSEICEPLYLKFEPKTLYGMVLFKLNFVVCLAGLIAWLCYMLPKFKCIYYAAKHFMVRLYADKNFMFMLYADKNFMFTANI